MNECLIIINDCTFKGTYYVNGVELPPKNCPIPFEKYDYKFKATLYLTKSRERILEGTIDLKYEGPKKNKVH